MIPDMHSYATTGRTTPSAPFTMPDIRDMPDPHGDYTTNFMFRPSVQQTQQEPAPAAHTAYYASRPDWQYPANTASGLNFGAAGGYPTHLDPLSNYQPKLPPSASPVNNGHPTQMAKALELLHGDQPNLDKGVMLALGAHSAMSAQNHDQVPSALVQCEDMGIPLVGITPVSPKKVKTGARSSNKDIDSTDTGESMTSDSDRESPHTLSDSDGRDSRVPVTSDSEHMASDVPVTSDSEHNSDSDMPSSSPESMIVGECLQDELLSSSDELGMPYVPPPVRQTADGESSNAVHNNLIDAFAWADNLPQECGCADTKPAAHSAPPVPPITPQTKRWMTATAARRHVARVKGINRSLETELREIDDEMNSLTSDLLALRTLVPVSSRSSLLE